MRLSLPAAALVVGGGMFLLGIAAAVSLIGGTSGMGSTDAWWPTTALATLTALLIAALAARWLGSRLGALAGLVYLTALPVLLPAYRDVADMLFCAVVTAAMGAFALANVPGRLRPLDRRWIPRTFYAAAGAAMLLAGPLAPAFILAGCLPFLVLCGDTRGMRFFADRVGIALFVLPAAVWGTYTAAGQGLLAPLTGTGGDGLSPPMSLPGTWAWLAVAALPWTPLVLPALIVGLRQGHYATPIWRFCGCWLLGPLLAMTVIAELRKEPFLTALLPPLAIIGAAGLSGLARTIRRCATAVSAVHRRAEW